MSAPARAAAPGRGLRVRAGCRFRRARSPAVSAATCDGESGDARRERRTGRYVAFSADADALSAEADPGRLERVPQGSRGRAHVGGISDSGALVTFASDAQNLTPDADYYGVYTRDVGAGTTVLHVGRHAVRGRAVDRGRRLARRLDQRRRRHHARQRSRPDGRVRARLPGGAARLRLAPAGLGAVPGAGDEHRGRRHRRPDDQRRRPLRRLLGWLLAPAGHRERGPDLPPRHGHGRDRARLARRRARRRAGRQHERRADDQRGRDARGVHLLRAPGPGGRRRRRRRSTCATSRAATTTLVSRADGAGRRAAGQRRDRRAHQRRRAARDVPQHRHEPRRGRRRDRSRLPARRGGGERRSSWTAPPARTGRSGTARRSARRRPADGRLVVFTTRANNLDPADPGPAILTDVYVRDTVAATTTLLSRRSGARRRQGDGLIERGGRSARTAAWSRSRRTTSCSRPRAGRGAARTRWSRASWRAGRTRS